MIRAPLSSITITYYYNPLTIYTKFITMCENSHFKRHQLLHYKVRPVLLQNASAFLSQSAMSSSMKCNSFFASKCESQVLLQSALVFFIKKCDVKCYFKCAWYLSATIVQSTKEQTKGFGHSSLHSHFFPLHSVSIFSQVGIPPDIFC